MTNLLLAEGPDTPSEMCPRLYQAGDTISLSTLRNLKISAIVNVSSHQTMKVLHPDMLYLWSPLQDSSRLPDRDTLKTICTFIVNLLQSTRRTVLVQCAMGINRSSLVTATVLSQYAGIHGDDLLHHIRARRPGALTNEVFAEYVRKRL